MVFALSLLLLLAAPSDAHPLGNFTINHLDELNVQAQRIDVRYVLDMAEIPAYTVIRERAATGRMTPALLSAWAAEQSQMVSRELLLTVDGTRLPLTVDRSTASTRTGAGGLATLYAVTVLHAALPHGSADRRVHFTDGTYPNRLGWKDIAVAPASEPTHALTRYPDAGLASPRNITVAAFHINAAGGILGVERTSAATAASGAPPSSLRSNQLSDLLARGTREPGFVVWTLLVAIGLGALHALEPGHGKTLLAVSLVGARATVRQATILASALTIAHTIGVIALGIAINLFKGYFVPETIYPWITLVSGIVITVIGARAIARQIRLRAPIAHVHPHEHAHVHPHEHVHEHHFGDDSHTHGTHTHQPDDEAHARAHAIPGSAPLHFGTTVWAAMSGGIAPCPAALVVLLAAVALDHVAYGILVVVAFSFGLAATLTALGIGVVRGAAWLQDRPMFDRFVTTGPLISAIVIGLIGSIMVGQGFQQQGATVPAGVVTIITALAIVGYAFSHPFAHRTARTI